MTNHKKKPGNNGISRSRRLWAVSVYLFLLLFLCPLIPGGSEARAQNGIDELKADFLFQRPRKNIGFRIGAFLPDADSELFKFINKELTLKKEDFWTWDLGMDIGFSVHERIDLVLSLDHSRSTKDSEFRNYVDEQGFPITQTTKFRQTPLTAGVKYLLIPRGRQIGQYSWVPSPIVPFVSGGAGYLWYEFSQHGDFVDYSTLEIFPADLKSSGATFTGYLGCGTEIHIFRSAYLNLDLRYFLANDKLGRDFVGFDAIDLNGIRLTTGIHWHF